MSSRSQHDPANASDDTGDTDLSFSRVDASPAADVSFQSSSAPLSSETAHSETHVKSLPCVQRDLDTVDRGLSQDPLPLLQQPSKHSTDGTLQPRAFKPPT